LKIINILTILSVIGLIPLIVRGYLNSKTHNNSSNQSIVDVAPVEEKDSSYHFTFILKKNPFGLKGTIKQTTQQTSQTTEHLLQGYRLMGVISNGKGNGYAVLETPSGEQSLYKVGQQIDEVGQLKGVWQDYIIAGQPPQRLQLVSIKEVINESSSSSQRPPSFRRPERKKMASFNLGKFIRKRGSNEYVIDRQKVEEAIENPQQLMTDARLQPAFRGGKQYGFILRNVKPNGIYAKLGLRNGDVLMKINEFDITDPETALRAFTELRGADEIVLHIMRHGREKTLKYIIE